MNSHLIISVLLMTTLLHISFAQQNSVPVKSHKVLTKEITHNQVSSIYDKNEDTLGSFYSSKNITVETEFDLGKNYLIDHILIRMKKDKAMHVLNISVGNSFNDEELLSYTCERPNESDELYKCQPRCRSIDTPHSGIIARRFVVKLLVPAVWVSVYEIHVFASPLSVSDDISTNRFVSPTTCNNQFWQLTNKTLTINSKIVTDAATDLFFEKPYIITEVAVNFNNSSVEMLDMVMINDKNKTHALRITLSDCLLQKSLYTCPIDVKRFSAKQLKIVTPGLTKVFVRGKPVFYPKLEIKTSMIDKVNLQMSCEYNQCDLSVHSDCTEETIKTGVKFVCANKRLIRMPSGSDLDSYVIVNHGKVEPVWQGTKFSVNSDSEGNMIVTMPRSYQYFGQYKCACIVADKMNTEITSDSTDLNETNFLEELIFETRIQYKLSENDAIYQNVSNNVIYLPKSTIESSFLPMKITMFSLITGNVLNVTYPVNDNGMESIIVDRSTPFPIKAFDFIPQSWSVATHKYMIDEVFPELINGKDISINGTSTMSKLQQREHIRMLDAENLKTKSAMWSVDGDSNNMKVNIIYAGTEEAKLYHTERGCVTNKTTVLASFTNSNCTSMDSRVSCSQLKNQATFLSFKDERNFAKDILLELVGTKNQNSIEKFPIKEKIVLNQDDVVIKTRYTSLATSSKNKNVNVVKVKMDVISKKINDFIQCGSVMVKITVPGQDEQQMILQTPYFEVDIDMTSQAINVTVTVTIVNYEGSHVAQMQITDPTRFSANNVELQDDQALNLLWNGIDEIARDFLQYYELKTVTTTEACNTTTVDIKSIPKSQTTGAKNRYQAPLTTVIGKHLIKMTVSVQPIFIGNKTGQVTTLYRQFNAIAPSTISIADSMLTTERTIIVIPSQSDISCDVKDVEFNVTSMAVQKLSWKAVSLGNLKYKITNLIPGRIYQLTAKVIYKYGPEDLVSKSYAFETADDISILKTKHVAQVNEFVNISCTADIGPADIFQKSVEWLRADKSLLPDGVLSVNSTVNRNTVFLTMDKALADHSGEYGCFTRPSASTGSMKITIVVNDLVVSQVEQKVDFNKTTEMVSVTCSSSAVGENNLIWIDTFGSIIPDSKSTKYSINKTVTDQNVYQSTLTIKEISVNTSGIYKCHKTIGNSKAVKEFLLYGDEQINIETLPKSSLVVGQKLRLRCSAKAGIMGQKVMWEIISSNDDVTKLMTTSYPFGSVQTTQDVEIINSLSIHQVTCVLSPVLKKPLSKTFQIALQPEIVVQGPTEVNSDTDLKFSCLGYPNKKNMQLKWIFYPKNQNTTGKVVIISEKQPNLRSYEPITLNLSLTKVKETETGRYECKFGQEVNGLELWLGKSIKLVVNKVVVVKPAVQDNAKKSAHSNGPMTVLFTLVIVATSAVYRRW